MKKSLLIIALLLTGLGNSFASHIPGGNITWTCDPANPLCYNFIFTQVINCPSTNPTTMGNGFTITNSCGLANPTMPVLNQTGVSVDVAQTCATATSTCNGGTVPGAWLATYEGQVCFPANCDSWTIDYELCCRDANSNTAGGSGNSMHLQSVMNTLTAPCNNGPVVTAPQFIPYMCAGQNNTYCLTTADPDADSTYYQMTSPLAAGGVPIAYNLPYTINAPLNGFVLDPNTGCMSFNQATTGNFVVAIMINSYDAFGNLISSVTQDYQIEVITCTNVPPNQPTGGGITNFNGTGGNGGAAQTGPGSLSMCYGDNVCFDITFTDNDPANILTLTTDGLALMPGATFTTTGTNPVTGTFCWTAQPGWIGNVVTFSVQDDACPIVGTNSFAVNFDITTGVWVVPDDTICGAQTSQLIATGGSGLYTWNSIAGPPLIVGTNFSCNPCANPVASPSATTTYVVTSTLSAACQNTDTVTVYVVPDITTTMTQSANSACLFDPIQLDVAIAPAGPGYTYSWTPATYLNSTSISNPLATITAPGTYTYYVDVTSAAGCIKTDSITVTIVPFMVPDITILTPDSMMACGDSILVDLDLGGGVPAVCGLSPTNACSGPTTQTTVGTGATNISSAPSPYYGFYEDNRIQMIYTAAELNALGFLGGKITQIAFEIVTQASTQNYSGFTIKMGCTALPDFQAQTLFEPGLAQVYTNASYAPLLGWNTHVLDNAYEWDGISNLIVEVCFDNASWTSTDAVAQTATAVKMVMYDYTDGAVGCVLNTPYINTSQLNRPNIRLTQCPTIPDPLAFNYAWTPNTNIITSTMQNPTVFPSNPTSYIVTVTDTGGNCSDTDTLNITVLCGACYLPAITVTNPTCKDGTNGSIVVDPTFVLGSEVQNFSYVDSITGTLLQTTLNVTAGMQDSIINIGAGAYTITMVDSSGCSQDTTIYLTEPDSVMINTITADDIVCIGGNIQIDATAIDGNGAPYNYTWTDLSTGVIIPGNGPHNVSPIVSPTCYSVFATDLLGCISSASQVCISIYPILIANTPNGTPLDTITVCPASANGGPFGTNITMSTVGGSGTGYNYDWYDNGTLVGNGGTITVTPTIPTTYVGVATDDCTTPADSVWITINWFNVITPDFVKNKADSCYPITVEFSNTSSPVALIGNTQWTFSGGGSSNGDPVSNTFNTPSCQDVTMTVTTLDGCSFTNTKVGYVCPYDYPVANFSMNPPITDLLNTQIQFTNLSDGGTPPLNSLWNFGSGLFPDTSVVTHPLFIYPDNVPGTYNVLLTVTDINGCQDTVMGTVVVNGIYLFYVPNSFTPDGDGTNDLFRPYGEGIDFSQYTMEIFDRWGEKLFSTSNAERGWDGTYKGKPVQNGTYVWKIIAKEDYGTIIHDNFGHVNLIK
jgi:gliding motility-associated-like protein